jgi:hypothetical protein
VRLPSPTSFYIFGGWAKIALLQTQVRTLKGELGAIFKRWYPDIALEAEDIPVAA